MLDLASLMIKSNTDRCNKLPQPHSNSTQVKACHKLDNKFTINSPGYFNKYKLRQVINDYVGTEREYSSSKSPRARSRGAKFIIIIFLLHALFSYLL